MILLNGFNGTGVRHRRRWLLRRAGFLRAVGRAGTRRPDSLGEGALYSSSRNHSNPPLSRLMSFKYRTDTPAGGALRMSRHPTVKRITTG